MMYKISNYSKKQAEKLGVEIKPSTRKNKKIDVYKNNKKIASIGALGYLDYPNYLKIDKKIAEEKRKNYKKRHNEDRKVKGSPGWFVDKILW